MRGIIEIVQSVLQIHWSCWSTECQISEIQHIFPLLRTYKKAINKVIESSLFLIHILKLIISGVTEINLAFWVFTEHFIIHHPSLNKESSNENKLI